MTSKDKIKKIQGILGVEQDGLWGPITQGALDDLLNSSMWNKAKASSFADPADIRAYQKCIKNGGTEAQCLKVGDNGIGVYGDDTTGGYPSCALNKQWLIERWGSVEKAKHQLVEVKIGGRIETCTLKDIGCPKNRIDLNPGACAAFNLSPPILIQCEWRWA